MIACIVQVKENEHKQKAPALFASELFSSLFVTVIFSNSKRLYINTLRKLTLFYENYPEICHIS